MNIKSRCTSGETRISGKNVRAFGTLGITTVGTNFSSIPSPASNGTGDAATLSPAQNASNGFIGGSGAVGNGSIGSFGGTFTNTSNSSSSQSSSSSSVGTTGTTSSGGNSFNVTGCYSTSATNSGSTFDGRVSVGVICKSSSDLLLNDEFSSTNNTTARPVLESKQLLVNRYPYGVAYTFLATGGNNRSYSISVTALCCPVS